MYLYWKYSNLLNDSPISIFIFLNINKIAFLKQNLNYIHYLLNFVKYFKIEKKQLLKI